MSDRTELLEAALNGLYEGVALADPEGRPAFWNRAAEDITGYGATKLIGRTVRELLDALVVGGALHWIFQSDSPYRVALIHVRHQLGHELPAMARILVLRDGLGVRIGTGVIFHP